MAFFKIASADVIGYSSSKTRVASPSLEKMSDWSGYRTDDGFLYVRVRAISSRVNKNWDGWPSDELAQSYKTFVGKPIFIDHNNSNPGRTRGVVVDAALHVDDGNKTSKDSYYASAPDNHKPPTWVELLMEVDAKSFPRLAKAIINKDIDGVSMGANVEYTKCSHCGNRAEDPSQFCSHILNKGAVFDFRHKDGRKTSKNSYEDCYKVSFFEISFVFDPADETALVRDIRHAHTASVRAAVENEGNNRHVFSEAFGDQTSDMWLREIAREAWNDGYNNNASSADPRSAAWQAAVDAVKGAGFPEEAVQVANKLAQTFDMAAVTHGEVQGADAPYEALPETEEHPTLREMALQHPNVTQKAPQLAKTAAPGMTPQIDLTSIPQDVDTLRAEKPCPLCGNTTEAGQCPTCGWESEPEGLDNPDLTKAKPNIQPTVDSQPIQGEQQPPSQPPMNGVPSGGLPPNGMGQGGSMGGVSAHLRFGTIYIDSAMNLIIEKTAAQPNLDGGRINTQEKPLLPISRQVSDRPKNQKTVSDSPKPVESKTRQGN